MKGFRVSNLISFNISNHYHTKHHLNSPLFSRLFSSSSSYNNRSKDGGRPPPRRRSDDGHVSSEHKGRSRKDSGNNRKPNYYSNDSKYRVCNSNSNSNINTSYAPFSGDDEQNTQNAPLTPSKHVENNNKIQDVDGFLERFKLGLDQDNNNNINNNSINNKNVNNNNVKFENLGGGMGMGTGMGEVEERVTAPEDADEIFRKMKETGLIPNAVAMLHGLCSDGLVQEAMKLFGVMRERGAIPEVVIYTAVVEGFCKAGKPDEAVRIFRKMQGNGIVPNAFSYGVLVQGLVKEKRLDDGFEFCLEMVEAGHSPNLATFTGLVSEFCKERGLEAAQIVIGKLKDKGFGFDEKSVRDFMEKKGRFSPMVWEAIFGKKNSQML